MLKQGMAPAEIERVLGQEMSNLATTGAAGDYLNSPPPDNSEICQTMNHMMESQAQHS